MAENVDSFVGQGTITCTDGDEILIGASPESLLNDIERSLKRGSLLQFRPVVRSTGSGCTLRPLREERSGVLCMRSARDRARWTGFAVERAYLTGKHVETADPAYDPSLGWVVNLEFTKVGGKIFKSVTARVGCRPGAAARIAIVVDGVIESAPQVNDVCREGISGGHAQISPLTEKEARRITRAIRRAVIIAKYTATLVNDH